MKRHTSSELGCLRDLPPRPALSEAEKTRNRNAHAAKVEEAQENSGKWILEVLASGEKTFQGDPKKFRGELERIVEKFFDQGAKVPAFIYPAPPLKEGKEQLLTALIRINVPSKSEAGKVKERDVRSELFAIIWALHDEIGRLGEKKKSTPAGEPRPKPPVLKRLLIAEYQRIRIEVTGNDGARTKVAQQKVQFLYPKAK